MKVLVELCSFENVTHEFAYTVDFSSHGARTLTKNPWQSNQHLTVRAVQGNLYSRTRVVYCQQVERTKFALGLQLVEWVEEWGKLASNR
jgi:hypothetical protein